VVFGRGASPIGQDRPANGKGYSLVRDAHHQEVHRGLTKVPLRAVENNLIWRILPQQSRQKTAKRRNPDLVVGEKTTDAPVVRLLLDAGLKDNSNLPEIRRRELQQSGGKASHELQSSPVPSEMIRENASDGSYVVHSERSWCQQKVAIEITTLLPGIRPVHF